MENQYGAYVMKVVNRTSMKFRPRAASNTVDGTLVLPYYHLIMLYDRLSSGIPKINFRFELFVFLAMN